uniref:Zinc finger CCHC domain-containing protein 8 n=1 Tax=Castor canadensis TaxID=51338 RepID=A0A8C0WVD5_CASCN
ALQPSPPFPRRPAPPLPKSFLQPKMAAEVDFGDLELFEAFDPQEESTLKPVHTRFKDEDSGEEKANGVGDAELRERLRQCEETIEHLRAENILPAQLKRKLSVLTRPSGILVNNTKLDGPLLQILFMNNTISKQYHQEIEEFVSNLAKRFEEQQKNDSEKTSFNLSPQPSSIVLEEDHKVEESCAIKNNKEAFSVVGSVLYFTNFCLDKLGQPLLNENPQLTEGWEIPKYQQVFSHIVSLEGQEIQVKAKRPRPHCFNCGSEEHQMKECPMPRNAARISEKRKEYMDACGEANNQNFQQRYHAEEVEERFGRFKPGVISEELQDALGVTDKSLPPFIYRMRQLGYPPGWLKEAELENSGLALYDGKDDADGETEAGEVQQNKSVTYDLSKLVNYPGFNISTPRGIPDEWRMFGSIPMQACQQKDVFANYLSSNFQSASIKSSSKRPSSQSSPSSPKKQRKASSSAASPADMDLDSGSFSLSTTIAPGTPPLFTPPPQGHSTTDSQCSPQTRPASAAMDEDALTLEDLKSNKADLGSTRAVASSPCPNELDLPFTEGKASEKLILDTMTVTSRNGGSQITKAHSSPDVSKFATGITPFEFENMAESTGMLHQNKKLVKELSRNQQKQKRLPNSCLT